MWLSLCLGCASIRNVEPAPLLLRIAPPPHIPVFVLPPDKPPSIWIWMYDLHHGRIVNITLNPLVLCP